MTAYKRGDYATALREWSPLAKQGHAHAQLYLGFMYYQGQGVPQDSKEGLRWYRLAAEQGDAFAQHMLGLLYATGQGVPQDSKEALRWVRLAAEQGHAYSQGMLGSMYYRGEGVPQDYVQAHMWLNLAAAQGDKLASEARALVVGKMSQSQIEEAQRRAREWKPKNRISPGRQQETSGSQPTASGTGFVISRQGHVLTNNHVIDGCMTIRTTNEGRKKQLTVVGTDPENDLALLKLPSPSPDIARFREGRNIRAGDSIVAVGFPLHGLLASEANVTTGAVSALAGIGNDTRFLQITVPIQPGNSGGPLLDQSGNIVGIIVSTLDALNIAKATGSLPQNVNFAINGAVAKSFLDSNRVEYESASSGKRLESSDVGGQAKKFTLLLECFK
jgi:S1-C subfamily serine protease